MHIEERKIQRLFRNGEVTRLIKKSWLLVLVVSVYDRWIGRWTWNWSIKVPLKYQGLNGTEIAISESQERHVDGSSRRCRCSSLLNVTKKILMLLSLRQWRRNQILSCTGMVKPPLIWNVVSIQTVRVVVDAKVVDKGMSSPPEERQTSAETLEADILEVLADLRSSQRASCNHFTVGRSTVNHPLAVATKSHQRKLLYRNASPTWRDNNCICYGARIQPLRSRMMVSISWRCLCGHRSHSLRLAAAGAKWSKARSLIRNTERMDKQAERFVNQ